MAKLKPKKNIKNVSPFKNYWNQYNYILLGLGIGIIILGFILMAQTPWDNALSLSISPIVLLIAYIVIFPLSILFKKKKSSSVNNAPSKN